MAKGIAKTIRKLPDKTNYIFQDRFENKQHPKKKKVKIDNHAYYIKDLKIMGYTDADIKLKEVLRGQLNAR